MGTAALRRHEPVVPPLRPALSLDDRSGQPGHRLGAVRKNRSPPTNRFSSTSPPARPTRRITSPKEWIAKYRGRFDQGWDKLREETLARQKKLGVVPRKPCSRPSPKAIKRLGKLTDDERSCSPGRWRSSPASASTPIMRSAASSQAIEELGQARRTRSSSTSPATTAPAPKGA